MTNGKKIQEGTWGMVVLHNYLVVTYAKCREGL